MDPVHIELNDFRCLFNDGFVNHNKIPSIKMIRQITGAGLKESKEFFENVIEPVVIEQRRLDGLTPHITNKPIQAHTYDEFKDFEERLQRVEAFVDSHNIAEAQTRAKSIFKET